jgi:DNA-binding CsgD family transcriptional regulator
MGLGVWIAWLFLISSGSIWLSDVEVDGYYLANLMLVMAISSTAVCLIAPYAQRFYEALFARRLPLMGIALLASVGALGIIAAGPYYFNTPWPFWPGVVLIGIFSGIFSLKCGQLFGAMDSRRVLFYSLLSEMMMVAISYFVLGNNIFHPISGGPPLSGIVAFALLPLIATYLVCLPAGDAPDTPGRRSDTHRDGENATRSGGTGSGVGIAQVTGITHAAGIADSPIAPLPKSPSATSDGTSFRFALRMLPSAFWRFLVVIFVSTVVSEMVRCYFVFVRMPSLTYIDSIAVLLLRTAFALLMLAFALRPRKQLRFSRMYLFSLVGIAVVMVLMPLLQIYNTILGSLIGFASNVIVFLIWCLLAGVTFEKQGSPVVIFGFGRSALLIGQTCGWLLGIWVLPRLTGTNWELVCYVGLAVVTLVMVTLFFSEKQFDRLFGEIAKAQVNLDFSLFSRDNQKKRRPWHEACQRAGKQAMLSSREQEIFELLVSGRSPENIATHLVLSLNTIRTHIRNIYTKFDVHNKAELVTYVEAVLKDESTPPPSPETLG